MPIGINHMSYNASIFIFAVAYAKTGGFIIKLSISLLLVSKLWNASMSVVRLYGYGAARF
jgi:hypothetical protein